MDRHEWLRALACAGLCAILNWEASKLSVSGISIHPGMMAITFAGAAIGPGAGFLAGTVGTAITDLLTGSLWWNWDLAFGLAGLIAGAWHRHRSGTSTGYDLMLLLGLGALGHVAAIYVGGLTDMAMGAPYATALGTWAFPTAVSNAVMGWLATPFVLLAWRGKPLDRGTLS